MSESIIHKEISVLQFYNNKKADFGLECLTGDTGFDNKIVSSDINRPGLILTGFKNYFLYQRIQVLGQTEYSYLKTLSVKKRRKAIRDLFSFKIPLVIITKGLDYDPYLIKIAKKNKIPVLRTKEITTNLIHKISSYLSAQLAPEVILHGSLIDVYGIGVLIRGESGIGKSELALDLVERGHRMVADDIVSIRRRTSEILMGSGLADRESLQHFMEIRGVGIIDLARIFGIRGIRLHKRVELQVNLIKWREDIDYERIGIKQHMVDILGVKIPNIEIPLVPGKNVSVIVEVIALNHQLKLIGVDAAQIFDRKLIELMKKEGRKLASLDEDME
ncbi:HPr(Ser) kinase/phosphatase [candidate division WOR-3 bacterium]|uniref:HPr kinase/phosphorylase n=1 Tax=candidate division TA06 bacterium TaxID=2250710 RepID=A0A660SDH7_UNCT6|nr:HPr(Ser) kinase/phosphatase [candidate division WOR-3 bacterium]RKX68051.1 MAG: HPr(Ser) kinase/phosphatase [candidate division TA06 bacterium]